MKTQNVLHGPELNASSAGVTRLWNSQAAAPPGWGGRPASPTPPLPKYPTLPHSIEAEQGVLGCLLLDPKLAFPVVEQGGLGKSHFYDLRHAELFSLLRKLHREDANHDQTTIAMKIRDSGLADRMGGLAYVFGLMNAVPSAGHVEYYIDELKDKKRRRLMVETAYKLEKVAVDTAHDSGPLLAEVSEQLRAFEKAAGGKREQSIRTPDELLALETEQNDNILGDRLLARGQSLTLMGAGGLGKSRLLLQLAAACILGRPFIGMQTHAPNLRWLIFQTENSVRRLQADLAPVRVWAGDDWPRLNEHLFISTLEASEDLFMNLDDRAVRRRLAEAIEKHEADVVCFDPLNAFGMGDLNTDRDMRATCLAINEIVQAGNPRRATVVLHHALTGKAGAARAVGFDRNGFGRNSKLLHSWTRGQINLAPGGADDNRTLVVSCGKCSNGQEFKPFAITLNAESMIYENDPDFDVNDWENTLNGGLGLVEASRHDELLRELCADKGGEAPLRADVIRALRDKLQCSESSAYKIVATACRRGVVISVGRQLQLPPKN